MPNHQNHPIPANELVHTCPLYRIKSGTFGLLAPLW
jgi:hypothetical protein